MSYHPFSDSQPPILWFDRAVSRSRGNGDYLPCGPGPRIRAAVRATWVLCFGPGHGNLTLETVHALLPSSLTMLEHARVWHREEFYFLLRTRQPVPDGRTWHYQLLEEHSHTCYQRCDEVVRCLFQIGRKMHQALEDLQPDHPLCTRAQEVLRSTWLPHYMNITPLRVEEYYENNPPCMSFFFGPDTV